MHCEEEVMIYRDRNKLAILELDKNEKNILMDKLEKIILYEPSNVIYCEKDGRLYGIITMGDIGRAVDEGKDYVTINVQFTCLAEEESIRARKIFHRNRSINALPILDVNKTLIGDLLRWDDLLRSKNVFKQHISITENSIALVVPNDVSSEKYRIYTRFSNALGLGGIELINIGYQEIIDYINDVDMVLIVDEDERRAIETWLIYIKKCNFLRDKVMTYRNFLNYEIVETHLYEMAKQGICCISLYFEENKLYRQLRKDIANKFNKIGGEANM